MKRLEDFPYINVNETMIPGSINPKDKVYQVADPQSGRVMVPVSHVEIDPGWFSRNHVYRFVAEFENRSLPLFYHPGEARSCLDIALDIAAAYGKFGLIKGTVKGTTIRKENLAALAAAVSKVGKRGIFDIPGHIQDAFHEMFDLGKYPHAGFYEVGAVGTENLWVLGRIKKSDIISR